MSILKSGASAQSNLLLETPTKTGTKLNQIGSAKTNNHSDIKLNQ